MTVEERNGYVFVSRRGGEVVCSAHGYKDSEGRRRVRGIEFTDERFRKSNRTRQAAMRALQAAGWFCERQTGPVLSRDVSESVRLCWGESINPDKLGNGFGRPLIRTLTQGGWTCVTRFPVSIEMDM